MAKELEGEFECLGKNTEKYITFSVPIKKEITKKDKNVNDETTKMSYKIKFLDSYRFMSTSLSNLVSNLSEGFHEFCNRDLNKFILLLRKGVCPYEYMGSWQRFDETSLPDKEAFYSNLNMEDITNVDYRHGKAVFEYLINKNLGDCHELYVQTNTLLLADVFENFRNMCIEVYELDPAHFLSAPGLAWQTCLKKTDEKLELLTNVDMLLMVGKGIRGEICHAIYRYAKANNKYMKSYNKDKEESFLQYLGDNNLYAWAMSQKLLVSGFKWK